MDRPAGSFIMDPETGELKPNMEDEAMRFRASPKPDSSDKPEAPNPKEKGKKQKEAQIGPIGLIGPIEEKEAHNAEK
jgi:hypothetical protein